MRLLVEKPGLPRGNVARLDLGYAARQYPDSTSRDHRRSWGLAEAGLPLGPSGKLMARAELWSLDFLQTGRRDQLGTDLDLTIVQPLHPLLTVQAGLEFGSVHHGLPSIQVARQDSDSPWEPVWGPDRRDQFHRFHVGFWWRRFALAHLEYGFRSQGSNSIDAEISRHDLTWLLARPLPLGLGAQFYGNLEHTRYRDSRLSTILVLRSGDPDAGDDDNIVAVRLSRPVSRSWSVEARQAWYRNQSLLVQTYYRKQILSFGLTWETGTPSGF